LNRSDIPRIAAQGAAVVKLIDKHAVSLFKATQDWQSPLRSSGAAGCKGEHADPTPATAIDPDPLALAHAEFVALLNAKDKADAALAAFVYHYKPIDPHSIDRNRPNLVPACIVCGGPAIPIRRGMCDACRKAFERTDHDDLERFKRERQREMQAARVHEHEVAS
jgi:hypothetical protein